MYVQREERRWMYTGRGGDGCTEGGEEMDVQREERRWMYRGRLAILCTKKKCYRQTDFFLWKYVA